MKVKVSEASGPVLDWMVAKVLGTLPTSYDDWRQTWPHYSTDPVHGFPILEREHIGIISPTNRLTMFWTADIGYESKFTQFDHDPLIAAMRCFVASKLGEEVEVPNELA